MAFIKKNTYVFRGSYGREYSGPIMMGYQRIDTVKTKTGYVTFARLISTESTFDPVPLVKMAESRNEHGALLSHEQAVSLAKAGTINYLVVPNGTT